jgi:hypothetical protein
MKATVASGMYTAKSRQEPYDQRVKHVKIHIHDGYFEGYQRKRHSESKYLFQLHQPQNSG